MTFELIGKTRVLISLCAQDMKDYSLEFDTMSLSDPKCKKAISSILSIAILEYAPSVSIFKSIFIAILLAFFINSISSST